MTVLLEGSRGRGDMEDAGPRRGRAWVGRGGVTALIDVSAVFQGKDMAEKCSFAAKFSADISVVR